MPDATPLIGILSNSELIDGVPHHTVRDVYVRAVTEVAGCAAVMLATGPPGLAPVHRLDGILLTGHASDVHPESYGAPPSFGTYDPARDAAALGVIRYAVDRGIPLLGICRGLQELNVAFGGTLRYLDPSLPGAVRHREDTRRPRDEQYLPEHEVIISPGGILHDLLRGSQVRVNSLHGQGIGRLAGGLRPEATAPDGTIEAATVTGARAFTLAVQWHPEWYAATDPVSRRIFTAFGAAARTSAALALGRA